jgi:hypothetical protein
MGTVKVSLEDLPNALMLGDENIRQAVAKGTTAGAHRGRALIVRRTPTDQGQLRASWRVVAAAIRKGVEGFADVTLAELINDAPHITIVELGAKPHTVSPEGWTAIYEWVRRHYRSAGGGVYAMGSAGTMVRRSKRPVGGPWKGDDPRVEAITNAIVWRIRKYGQKPTLFVRNSVDELRDVMAKELNAALARVKSGARGGK